MKIKVKAKSAWSKSERALAYSAASWAADELGIEVSPIPIVIKLKGETLDYGDSVDLHDKIVIRLFKSENWLRTLFHEMEHARQYLFGELMLEVDYVIWQGEMTRRNEEYWFTPWEVEARRVEEELYEGFVKKFLDKTSSL
jgi:hypothetical protein